MPKLDVPDVNQSSKSISRHGLQKWRCLFTTLLRWWHWRHLCFSAVGLAAGRWCHANRNWCELINANCECVVRSNSTLDVHILDSPHHQFNAFIFTRLSTDIISFFRFLFAISERWSVKVAAISIEQQHLRRDEVGKKCSVGTQLHRSSIGNDDAIDKSIGNGQPMHTCTEFCAKCGHIGQSEYSETSGKCATIQWSAWTNAAANFGEYLEVSRNRLLLELTPNWQPNVKFVFGEWARWRLRAARTSNFQLLFAAPVDGTQWKEFNALVIRYVFVGHVKTVLEFFHNLCVFTTRAVEFRRQMCVACRIEYVESDSAIKIRFSFFSSFPFHGRLMPVIGQFQISDIARVSFLLHEQWGKIVRLGGLLGRPDLLFVYDADEIEKVCTHN